MIEEALIDLVVGGGETDDESDADGDLLCTL